MLQAEITFTDAAVQKVHQLKTEEGNPNLNLRVYIMGGGCSGFQYGFTFDEKINEEEDYICERPVGEEDEEDEEDEEEGDGGKGGSGTIKLLIDSMSYTYLKDATIDYRSDVNGEQFVIKNPNAKTTCGCGSSFSA